MKQETSVATILCYSTFARARAVWSCVLRINDQKWYHEHCYYEIRGLTPFAVILVFAVQQPALCNAARASLHCTRGVFAEQRASLQCSRVENTMRVELLQKRATNSSLLTY
jgi:hypothetical protein